MTVRYSDNFKDVNTKDYLKITYHVSFSFNICGRKTVKYWVLYDSFKWISKCSGNYTFIVHLCQIQFCFFSLERLARNVRGRWNCRKFSTYCSHYQLISGMFSKIVPYLLSEYFMPFVIKYSTGNNCQIFIQIFG